MFDGLPPVTRLRVTELPSGCWTCTLLSGPMENFCQSMPVRGVLVSMRRLLPSWEMRAAPEITSPCCGKASMAAALRAKVDVPNAMTIARLRCLSENSGREPAVGVMVLFMSVSPQRLRRKARPPCAASVAAQALRTRSGDHENAVVHALQGGAGVRRQGGRRQGAGSQFMPSQLGSTRANPRGMIKPMCHRHDLVIVRTAASVRRPGTV
ncbi:hypothetical protein D3C85_813440 [compost metagenome]